MDLHYSEIAFVDQDTVYDDDLDFRLTIVCDDYESKYRHRNVCFSSDCASLDSKTMGTEEYFAKCLIKPNKQDRNQNITELAEALLAELKKNKIQQEQIII